MKSARVAIIVPAFNESELISDVVSGISSYGSVIVVNDGSTDNTEQLARDAGAIVVSHEFNRGYDRALASGLENAVAGDFEFAIIVDGDGQHQPEDVQAFLTELWDGADLVIGIRDRFQRISEKAFSVVAKTLWSVSDPLCGMKGYRISKLRDIGCLCSYSSIGSELVVRAVRTGWNVKQVPLTTRDRKGRSRFGAGIYADWIIFRAMLLGLVLAKAYVTKC